MNRKRIKAHLDNVISNFLASIDDTALKEAMANEIIVTGGAFTSLLTGEQPKDYDIYFKTKPIVKRVANYYCNRFNDEHKDAKNRFGYSHKAIVIDGAFNIEHQVISEDQQPWETAMLKDIPEDRIKIVIRSDGVAGTLDDPETILENGDDVSAEEPKTGKKDKPYRIKFLSTNAITLTDHIQLVIRFYGTPGEIHENFDFVHTTNYYDYLYGHGPIVLNPEALESTLDRRLKYVGSLYPLCSMIRTRKFIKKGWKIDAGQYLKIAMQLSRLTLTDPVVLEEQLIGVDTMYFMTLIRELRETQPNMIGSDYIISLVDKIFG